MSVAAYPTYEQYRESHVDWIGTVPATWDVKPLRRFISVQSGDIISKEAETPQGYAIYGGNGVRGYTSRCNTKGPIILIGRVGALCGNVHLVEEDVWASEHAYRAFPRSEFDISFLAYAIESVDLNRFAIRTAQPLLNSAIVHAQKIASPSLPEQRVIAKFLDGKCARIDEAMRIKEEQITLLRERRQILIQEAVTRGLNPDTPMKDSGVDWIGQIPAHWEVKRGKHLFREINERSEEGTEELLSVSHTTGVTARSEKNVNMFLAEDYSGSKLCQPGDIVINTMWAWMGALGVSDLTGIVSPSYGVYRALEGGSFNRRFLEWLLRTTPFIEQYNKISTGLHSSRLRLYPHMFLGLFMALPDRAEQDAIVEYVEREARKIDKAISVKESQITALREYKASLINSAVTGKIKVI